MMILEALLLTSLITTLAVAIYTDLKASQIRNNLVLAAAALGIILDILYYTLFARTYTGLFLVNLFVVFLISFFLYSYHLWAAGDSKLFFVSGLFIPGRFYTFWDIGTVPCFVILILVFSLAFIYIICESFVIGLRQKNLLKFSFGEGEVDYVRAVFSYFSMVAATMIINWGIWRLFGNSLQDNPVLSLAVSFFIVLSLSQLRNHLSNRGLIIVAVIGWCVVLMLTVAKQMQMNTTVNFRSWLLVLALIFARMIAEKYNYEAISTKDAKQGQILSAATVIGFKTSRVQGLPTGTTEDLRSRITEEEAESIRRWESSKNGKPYIIIVRKIPFAIFIGIGTCIFLVIEVAMK